MIGLATLGMALILFELIYRFQLIDTYRPELVSYNQPSDLRENDSRPTVLIMGDSFTAGNLSYPALLRSGLPEVRIINAAIPGTGIIQAGYVAPRRFEMAKPFLFIYQVYLGNDLFDIDYPLNWETLSGVRNLYWLMAGQFRSIGFLNYRLGQIFLGASPAPLPGRLSSTPSEQADFSPEKYNPRDRVYFQADPGLIENQVMLAPKYRTAFLVFRKKLPELLAHCPEPQCHSWLLIVPHCAQVSEKYLQNMEKIGARFSDRQSLLTGESAFVRELKAYLKANRLTPVQVLDLTDSFRQLEKNGPALYYGNDPHLNLQGQKIVAESLKSMIKNRL